MKLKTRLKKLARVALFTATGLLTSCVTGSSGRLALQYPNNGILRLKKGESYTAEGNETWYSLHRYQLVERDAINAAAALKQNQNH